MDRAASEPMAWGRDDCALWCADVILEALGYDPAQSFRGRYSTQLGARRILRAGGLLGALRATARRHRWHWVKPDAAEVGDIGLIAGVAGASCVICRAPGWFVGRNEAGFTALPAVQVRMAWAV